VQLRRPAPQPHIQRPVRPEGMLRFDFEPELCVPVQGLMLHPGIGRDILGRPWHDHPQVPQQRRIAIATQLRKRRLAPLRGPQHHLGPIADHRPEYRQPSRPPAAVLTILVPARRARPWPAGAPLRLPIAPAPDNGRKGSHFRNCDGPAGPVRPEGAAGV
jgi:hypothetical protein